MAEPVGRTGFGTQATGGGWGSGWRGGTGQSQDDQVGGRGRKDDLDVGKKTENTENERMLVIPATRKRPLKELASLFGGLGFTRIELSGKTLVIEKVKGQDLRGRPYLEYAVTFKDSSIELEYTTPPNRSRDGRLVELLPIFLNILQVAEEYYDVKPSGIFAQVNQVLANVSKVLDREAVEFSSQLSELQARHADLMAKYSELVRTSEANTRILLECEQQKSELEKKLARLSGMSNDLLKELLYDWIKLHGGTIDIKEFSKANAVAISRAEDGLNLLIQEGYIRRRIE